MTLTSLGASHDIQDPENVDLTVLDCGVAVDAGDGANVHLAPLVRVKGEDERHGIVNASIRVDYELAPQILLCHDNDDDVLRDRCHLKNPFLSLTELRGVSLT